MKTTLATTWPEPQQAGVPADNNGAPMPEAPIANTAGLHHPPAAQRNPQQGAPIRPEVLAELLDARRFDIDNPPPPGVPVFMLAGESIATRGNVECVQAQAKAGKTAAVTAIIASTMEPTGDCLGFTSENPNGWAVVHFDTEQSPADAHNVIATALRRAGRERPPGWLRSYRIADLSTDTRRQFIAFEIERAKAAFGGILAVILDGSADFIRSTNDEEEAIAFADDLHSLAIRHDTVLFGVIHENPSGFETGKTRGHFGSQLERKAETNLRLVKENNIVTMFSEKARHAGLMKSQGPRFEWSSEAGMHVSVATGADGKAEAAREDAEGLAGEVFKHVPAGMGLSYGDLLKGIGEFLEIKKEGAKRHYRKLRELGIIYKKGEKWVRN